MEVQKEDDNLFSKFKWCPALGIASILGSSRLNPETLERAKPRVWGRIYKVLENY